MEEELFFEYSTDDYSQGEEEENCQSFKSVCKQESGWKKKQHQYFIDDSQDAFAKLEERQGKNEPPPQSYSFQNVDDEEEEENKLKKEQAASRKRYELDFSDPQVYQEFEEEYYGAIRREQREKNRKVRVTITKEKLAAMNQIFAVHENEISNGRNPTTNLKEIAVKLELGYSTILHKYREFRLTGRVRGGALIASLDKKRKYKKSFEIEDMINQALADRPFFSAAQMAEFISQKYGKTFSRSIISRHLGEMGYSYKNLKNDPLPRNKRQCRQICLSFCQKMKQYFQQYRTEILFIDELAICPVQFQKKKLKRIPKNFTQIEQNYISVIVGTTYDGKMKYAIKQGFFTKQNFAQFIKDCIKTMSLYSNKKKSSIVLATDMNPIHFDTNQLCQDQIVRTIVERYNIKRIFFPPHCPELNPVEQYFLRLKEKISKKGITGFEDLKQSLRKLMEEEVHSQNIQAELLESCNKVMNGRQIADKFALQN